MAKRGLLWWLFVQKISMIVFMNCEEKRMNPMKKNILCALVATAALSGVYADGTPHKHQQPLTTPSNTGFRFEVGVLGGGSMSRGNFTVMSVGDTQPDSKKDMGLVGGHGGGFFSAGYQFPSALVVGLQAEGSVANDIGHFQVNASSNIAVPLDIKIKRTQTYAGGLFLGKVVGKMFPYFKLGYRQHNFTIITALQNQSYRHKNVFKIGSPMAGFGCNTDITKNIFVGADTDISIGSRAKFNVPPPIGMKNNFKPVIVQITCKFGYRF
ncbi:MAG: hypothetical protein H6849_04675 [Alphaproteobacteria bacterium]|nr:MAG: hypothetical protein H6849_04675 [Alphaproteobacteria bacterium]